jgi:trigger factor
MLGEPLPSEKQEPADLEKGTTFTFMFDIAVAPEFKVTLNGRDKVDYYNIKVDDKILDQQVEMYAQRAGSYEKGEQYEENDLLKGDIRELDENGNTK